MFRWAPNRPIGSVLSQASGSEVHSPVGIASALSNESGSREPQWKPGVPVRTPVWAQVVPFFLSAFFYLSVFLAVFSPLPLLLLGARKGKTWAWMAALTNAMIVGAASGTFGFVCFLVFVVVSSLTLLELIQRKKTLEWSAVITLIVMGIFSLISVVVYSQYYHLNPIHELREQISEFVNYVIKSVPPESRDSLLGSSGDVEEWKKSLLIEFPSAMAIFSLILVWANLTLLFRVNPNGFREKLGLDASYIKKWKTPLYLVWPTIFSGMFLVSYFGVVSDVALNFFKFLMAIYAIQGLSVLSYFFDLWDIRGFFRLLGYSLSVFLMMPMILVLGFFDLWFDFRGKFRQS